MYIHVTVFTFRAAFYSLFSATNTHVLYDSNFSLFIQGTGSYDFEMELLYDTLDTPIHKWEPLESISGTYDQDIVKNEMAELKFARPVHIKVGLP